MLLCEQQFRGVGDLSQSCLLHLIDAQLGGGAETVLHGAENAVQVVLVALELDNRVDNVFQNLRTSQRSLLGDVANEDDGHAAGLGKAQQGRGALTYLGDAARTRLHLVGGNGLYGVDDDEFGLHVADVFKDGLQGVLAEDEERPTPCPSLLREGS